MGSKRHLAEPGRRRLLLRLALGLALIYGLRQHLSLRSVAHDRLVALQAMKSTGTSVATPSAERFFAPRAAQPLREPSTATRRLIVAEADTLVARSIPVTWPPSQVYDGVMWRRAPRLAAPPVGVGDRNDQRAAVRRLDVAQIAFRASRRRVRDAEFFGNDRTAAAFVTKRLAEIIDSGGARKSCLLGDDRTRQIQTLQKASSQRGNSRIAVGVVSYDHLRDFPGLDSLKAIALSAARDGGFPEGLFAFASVDAATHAALCAVGLPSIATNDKVNDEGLAIITRAFRDASLRSAARNGRRLRSADLTDADAFEALLEGSTLEEVPEEESDDISEVKTVEVAKPSLVTGAPLDGDAKSQHSARFQACADLAFVGVDCVAFDASSVYFVPDGSARQALVEAVSRKPPRKPANPEILHAVFQDEIRKPCLPFVVSKATNSTAWALHRLAGLARIAPTREHLQRAVAATLGLGSSDRGRLEGDEVVCGARPHFGGVNVQSERLAAVVLNEPPGKDESGSLKRMRMSMGRKLLALELGLVPSPVVPDEGSLSIDAGAGRASTVVVDAQCTLKTVRLVIAHAIAACLETNRQLQLPSLVIGERRFFLWSYLDLKSAEDLGLKWRPTQSLQGGGNASVISVDEKTLRLATDDARDQPVVAFALPPKSTAGRAALDLVQLHRPSQLRLHLPFLSQPRLVKKHADQLARAVLAELRWCPAHLRAEHDARVATAAASCWGRGVAVAA
jgi:hypothetical protein